ncbi:MAG: DUF2147 domain-containing protein [Legionella sp.]
MKRLYKVLILVVMFALCSFSYAQQSIIGHWLIVDDKTGQRRAIVHLDVNHGRLTGTIVEVFAQIGDTGLCSKCPEQFKNKPIKGLQFVWGLKDSGNGRWGGGQILDAKSGKIYRVNMTVKGDKLYVRGYIGLSLLGRTQIWNRHG